MRLSSIRVLLTISLAPLFLGMGCTHTQKGETKDAELTFSVASAPEWTALFQRTSGWFGGDGIFAIPMSGVEHSGSTEDADQVILFSDTMVGEIEDSVLQKGYHMVNNSIAKISGKAPLETNIEFLIAQDSTGTDQAVFIPSLPPIEPNEYYWLGDGFVDPVNHNTYVFAYRVVDRPQYEYLGFDILGAAMITIPAGSEFPFTNQQQTALPYFFQGENRQFGAFGAAIMPNTESAGAPNPDGYIYLYGVRDPRKQLIVARVKPGEIETLDSWRFWDGEAWNTDYAQTAELTDSISNEMSVTPLENGKYLAVFQVNTVGTHIGIRIGESPVGPWGPVQEIWDCSEAKEEAEFTVYNAKAHPSLSQPGELLISYNVNSMDFWNQIEEYPQLYRPRFVRLKWE